MPDKDDFDRMFNHAINTERAIGALANRSIKKMHEMAG